MWDATTKNYDENLGFFLVSEKMLVIQISYIFAKYVWLNSKVFFCCFVIKIGASP